jgi:hypothetical protein
MTRRLVFRILLAALAASAVLGVTAVFADSSITWRLLGTALTIAFATLLMVPFAPGESAGRLDLFRRTVIGFLAGGSAITVSMVWDFALIPFVSPEWPAFVWFWLGIPALIVAVPGLRSRRSADRALATAEGIAIWGAIGSVAVAMLALAVLPRGMWGMGGIETTLVLGFIVLGGVVIAASSATGLRTASTDRFAPLATATAVDRIAGWSGLLGAGGWVVLAMITTVDRHVGRVVATTTPEPQSILWAFATAAATVGLACGIGCALGLSRVRSPLRFLRHVAVAVTIALGAVWTYACVRSSLAPLGEYSGFDRLLGQLSVALLIVDTAALASAFILMRLARAPRIGSDPIDSLAWTCPRCATKADIAIGEHVCTGCALAVQISFRDDRCPGCGYDLHAQPEGVANCPECGRARQMPAVATA